MPSAANHTTLETNNAAPEKKQPHQWSSNPVEEWAKEQVIFIAAIRNKRSGPSLMRVQWVQLNAQILRKTDFAPSDF